MGSESRKLICSTIDAYVGRVVGIYRLINDLTAKELAVKLGVTEAHYLNAEAGIIKFRASDLFILKREFGLPLEDFFSCNGELYSEISMQNSEITDVLHYFLNIKDPKVRAYILSDMKTASAVF